MNVTDGVARTNPSDAAVGLLAGIVVGLDGGTQDRDTTEHPLREVVDRVRQAGLAVTLACTHFVAAPAPHWAASLLRVSGRTTSGRQPPGRRLRGQDLLPPTLPVEDVLALTAIEEACGVGGSSTAAHG